MKRFFKVVARDGGPIPSGYQQLPETTVLINIEHVVWVRAQGNKATQLKLVTGEILTTQVSLDQFESLISDS